MTDAHSALPRPGVAERAHSEKLVNRIREQMLDHGGHMEFARFMACALYEPELGYYRSRATPFGEQGDFITSAHISPLFGACMARQIAQTAPYLKDFNVMEFGAGDGKLSASVLQTLHDLQCLPTTYNIIELSANLRGLQQQNMAVLPDSCQAVVHWMDRLPERFTGIVFANEVVDAMPVHIFHHHHGHTVERCVSWQDGFQWCERPPSDRVLETVKALGPMPATYTSEIGLHGQDWIRALADMVEQGLVLLIDYGFSRAEFYHPQRSTGTLMCHYRHHSHADPFIHVGLQDITAHVDFTALADVATAAGLECHGFTSQAFFLIHNGLEQAATAVLLSEKERITQAQAIKKLTMPNEMGELFKVLALSKDLQCPLDGFTLDMRHKLYRGMLT